MKLFPEIDGLPGCCAVEVLYDLYDGGEWSGSQTLQELVDGYATAHTLVATTVSSQRAAIRQLKELGFRKVASFVNDVTKNRVTMWLRPGNSSKPRWG